MYILEWYKSCPVCDAQGAPLHSDTEDNVTYQCVNCGFSWKSESKCDYHAQDDERGGLCCRDSSIGECKGSLCPRLKEVPLSYRGFREKRELDYPKDYVKVSHDVST